MGGTTKETYRNLLIRRLNNSGFEALSPHLEQMDVQRGENLIDAEEKISWVYFMESGICSLVLTSSDGRKAEIGIVGPEGLVGAAHAFGIDWMPHDSFIQVRGTVLKAPAEALRAACAADPDFDRLLTLYSYVLGLQAAQTALANANYTVEERLARWLLMCQDRLGGNEIELTHDFLSTMLSVRRSTVTLTTHLLEGSGLIRAQRGRITILQRKGLMEIAAGSYGMPEAEYERIVGPFRLA